MIVRVKFEGIVRAGEDKISKLKDYIDIHVVSGKLGLECAKSRFELWVSKSIGIKGASGVYHPVDPTNNAGEVKVISVEEIKKEK
jgi:hypothetical protein